MTMEHAIKMRLSLPPTQVLEVDIQRVMKGGALRVAGCVEGEISVGRLALLRVLREQVYLNDWLEFSHFSQAFICARVKNVHFMNCFFRFQLVGREEIFLGKCTSGSLTVHRLLCLNCYRISFFSRFPFSFTVFAVL
ncbi:unnamed protein product [Urochloa humidicola]